MNKRNETTEKERQKEEHTVPDMNKRTEKEEKEPTSTTVRLEKRVYIPQILLQFTLLQIMQIKLFDDIVKDSVKHEVTTTMTTIHWTTKEGSKKTKDVDEAANEPKRQGQQDKAMICGKRSFIIKWDVVENTSKFVRGNRVISFLCL